MSAYDGYVEQEVLRVLMKVRPGLWDRFRRKFDYNFDGVWASFERICRRTGSSYEDVWAAVTRLCDRGAVCMKWEGGGHRWARLVQR